MFGVMKGGTTVVDSMLLELLKALQRSQNPYWDPRVVEIRGTSSRRGCFVDDRDDTTGRTGSLCGESDKGIFHDMYVGLWLTNPEIKAPEQRFHVANMCFYFY